jgi:hypothetical protein
MKVTVLREAGIDEALLGLSLSYNQQPDKMKAVADRLAHKGNGESKFLESVMVWIDVTAPRYWWSQADTYRIGVSKQSQSTMHSLLKRPLTEEDCPGVPCQCIDAVNKAIEIGDLETAKAALPEGFLQRRIVCLSYASLQRIVKQRRSHKLAEWHVFCDEILAQANNPEWIEENK